jgi:hypothetical protein
METNYFARFNQIDVSQYVEKKGQFNYLSWPFAVQQLRQADPSATWSVARFDGLPFLKTEAGFFVEVAVTVQGVTLSQIHPVLDAQNNPIETPNSFDINTSIQRCLVKSIALHGLGLSVYAGEDLPATDQQAQVPAAKIKAPVTEHPTATPASPAQIRFIEALITETSSELAKVLAYFRVESLAQLSSNAASRAITSLQSQRRAA